MLVAALLLSLSPALPGDSPADEAPVVADDDGSLESFLVRARAERDKLHARFADTVRGLVERLEAKRQPGKLALEEIRGELDALGVEVAPVLLPWIDPGEGLGEAPRFRAKEVTEALVRLEAPGIVGDLIVASVARRESHRLNAIRVLGAVPEKERAGAHLAELFRRTDGDVRLACIVSLAALGGSGASDTLAAALSDDDPKVVRAVLRSLARAGNRSAAPFVRNLTEATGAAAPVATDVVAYWRACPELVDQKVLEGLVRLALRTDVDSQDRVAIVNSFVDFEAAQDRDFKDALDPLTQTSDSLLREAALVCKTVLGDRNAKRELMGGYDDVIDGNEDWWKGYQQRGDVLLRIREYASAAKDYKRALELIGSRAHDTQYDDIWINLARCYILSNKLSKAASTIEEMVPSRSVKDDLREDPDFAEMREHSRYGKLLE